MRNKVLGLMLLIPGALHAQEVSIEIAHANVAYLSVPNPFVVTIPEVRCNAISVSTTNGRLEGSGCRYTYYPAQAGYTTIKIMAAGRKVDEKQIRVKPLPTPMVTIGGLIGGGISKSVLTSATAPFAKGPDDYPDFTYKLTKCTLILKKQGTDAVTYQRNMENAPGVAFSAEDIAQLSALQRGDSILIENGQTMNPNSQPRRLATARFFVR